MKIDDIQWSDKARKGHWPIGGWPDDRLWDQSATQTWRNVEITPEGLVVRDENEEKL